jgi:hypothetical protein
MSEFAFPIRIQLTSRVEDFEEIFLDKGKLPMTLQDPVLFYTVWSLAFLIIDLFIYSITPVVKSAWFILILSSIVSIFWWHETIKLFYSRWQWWNQISAYMEQVSKIKTAEIILDEATFQMNIDEDQHLLSWSSISYSHFNKQYIHIKGSQEFTIPLKSLSSEDFELLKNVIRKQINREEKDIADVEKHEE